MVLARTRWATPVVERQQRIGTARTAMDWIGSSEMANRGMARLAGARQQGCGQHGLAMDKLVGGCQQGIG